MRAVYIVGAIVFAWISGASADGSRQASIGAVVFLVLSISCGWCAWQQ